MKKSDHQVPFETVEGHGENTCKLSKKGSKSVLFCRYTADWCVCVSSAWNHTELLHLH